MAFWPVFRRQRSSINEILEKEDFTLEELLDQDDIVQECRYLNDGLLDYLSQPEVVEKLVRYVIAIPEKKDEKSGEDGPTKYPYIASELFECGIGAMHNALFEKPELLILLFSILERKPPMDPSHVAYFRKVVSVLIHRKFEELTEFMRDTEAGQKILGNMLNHIGLHSILELLNLLTWDDERSQPSEDHIDWLVEEKLIPRLVSKLDPSFEKEPEVHANAAQALVDAALRAPVDHGGISAVFSDKETLKHLFQFMVSGNDSSLQHSLSAVIALIQRHLKIHSSSEEEEFEEKVDGSEEKKSPTHAGGAGGAPPAAKKPRGKKKEGEAPGPPPPLTFQDLLLQFLPELVKLLLVEPKLAMRESGRRFGPSRLKLVELLLWALRTQDPILERSLIQLHAMPTLLDLFQQHEWHNMLHIRVANIVEALLEGQSLPIQRSLFLDCKILDRLVSMSKKNDSMLERAKGTRAGFMGHVIHMSNSINEWFKELCAQSFDLATEHGRTLKDLKEIVSKQMESKEWQRYVETSLASDNYKMHIQIGGHRPSEGGIVEEAVAEEAPIDDDDDDLFNFDEPEIEDGSGGGGGSGEKEFQQNFGPRAPLGGVSHSSSAPLPSPAAEVDSDDSDSDGDDHGGAVAPPKPPPS